jgi:predicted porin
MHAMTAPVARSAALRKNILCGAVAGALLLPAYPSTAGHSIYGDLRYSLNSVDDDATTYDRSSFENNASRLGVKGEYDFGNGLSGIYHIELAINPDKGSGGSATGNTAQDNTIDRRFAFAGLKGGFGTALFGTASSPYKMAGVKLDPFYDTSAGTGFAGANFGLSGYTNGFFDNAVAYFTPNWGGLGGNAMMVLDEGSNDQNHHYNLGLAFEREGLGAGLQWLNVNAATAAKEVNAYRPWVKYGNKTFSVGLSYEKVDMAATDAKYLYLAGTYNATDKLRLAAAIGKVDDSGAASTDGDGVTVGVFYKLFDKTELHALYSKVDRDSGLERNTLAVGLSQKFDWGSK